MVLPACVASMVHFPVAKSVTVVLFEMLQVNGVVEAKLTVKPEEDVALTLNVALPNGRLPSVPKLMVCDSKPMMVTSPALLPPDPPPETLTWFVTDAAAPLATFTVTVIAG